MKIPEITSRQLIITLILFCFINIPKPILAQYDVNNTGVSDVNGLTGSDVQPATGGDFGTVQAIADTNNAYALFGDGSNIQISGDIPIDGIINAQAGNNGAYGLFTNGSGTITTEAINGTISATAVNNLASGLYANESITIGDVNGTISAHANSNAYSIRSYDSSIVTGVINGTVSAIADANSAYAFWAGTSITSGNINGEITATAGNNDAYGFYANNSITIGDVNGTIEATANSNAYGLRAYLGSISTDVIDGTISAIADTNSAYGLSSNTTMSTGNINGSISATAGNNDAYGLFANGSITTGDVNGTITTSANLNAYGMHSYAGSIITGAITNNITSTSDTDSSYGLSAYSSITTGNISGAITTYAGGNSAYGIKSSNGMSIGNISSDIYSRTGDSGAYGLFSSGDQITIGDIEGTVYGRSDANDSFGIYSYSNSLTTGEITGNVWAYSAGEYSYGILSYGAMDLTINGGYIAGLADANNSTGGAIQSGRLNSHVLNTQNANDSIEIVSGSRIFGDIDLGMAGTDNDILTLSGVDSNSTTLNDDLKNIETINLTGGTWYINGEVSNNENGITMTGGVLGGTGTLGSLNVNSGTFAPGNSIGTTTIDGNFTIETGSTLEIEVDNSGNSDKLVISGDANINGGTLKAISTQTIGRTHEYTIIEANNVSGTFDVLDTALLETILSEYTAGLGYAANSVTLTVIPEQFDNTDFLMTANQISLGSALQQISDNGGNAVTTALQNIPTLEEVRNAYDQLSGQTRVSLASVSSTSNDRFKDTVSNRLHNTKTVFAYEPQNSPLFAMAQPDEKMSVYDTDRNLNSFAIGSGTQYFASEQWGLWLRGYGSFGERDTEIGSSGYKYRTYGTGFGMDYKVRKDLLFGLSGGYSSGNVNYSLSRDVSDITSIPIGIYSSWFTKNGYVDSIISYASMNYETDRYVDLTSENLKGEFDGFETSAYFETGRNLFWGKNTLIQPMAAMQISYMNLDSYSETGGSSALTFDEQIYKSYKSSLGMKIKTHLGKNTENQNLTLELRGKWQHEFGDAESNINASFNDSPSAIFKVSDSGLPRDSTILGIGLRQINNQNVMLFVDYDTSINPKDTSHIISAGLRYRW